MSGNAYDVVRQFERRVADYAGSPFAVAVDTCSAALFLACLYCRVKDGEPVLMPKRTYVSAPLAVLHAGGKVQFEDRPWQGLYQFWPFPIWDSALRFTKGMYERGRIQCLSFHSKKILNIGRGGMILTSSADADRWFRRMRYDGREECPLAKDDVALPGWPLVFEPERAARGLTLMDVMPEYHADLPVNYPDISKFKVFQTEHGS